MTETISPPASMWLLRPGFDVMFVVGTVVLGLVSALVVVADPDLFGVVLALDIWLLGYHHVISTFSRLCATKATMLEHIGLFTWAPVVVIAGVAAVGFGVGFWALATIYLYWQWFHYTRQSWGVARVYERKSGLELPENPTLFKAAFYLLPLWGILHRSHQNHDEFLGTDFWSIPVPGFVVNGVGVLAVAALGAVAVVRFRAWRAGVLPVAHTMVLVGHFVIFAFGYLLISNIDHGWLAINVWHNAQYIGFVWYFNNRSSLKADKPSFLQRLSRPGRLVPYLLISVVASTLIYLTVALTVAAVVAPIVVYQAINFHHYLVDGKIWKVRKKAVSATLGLS